MGIQLGSDPEPHHGHTQAGQLSAFENCDPRLVKAGEFRSGTGHQPLTFHCPETVVQLDIIERFLSLTRENGKD